MAHANRKILVYLSLLPHPGQVDLGICSVYIQFRKFLAALNAIYFDNIWWISHPACRSHHPLRLMETIVAATIVAVVSITDHATITSAVRPICWRSNLMSSANTSCEISTFNLFLELKLRWRKFHHLFLSCVKTFFFFI